VCYCSCVARVKYTATVAQTRSTRSGKVVPYSFFFISIFFLLYGEAEGGPEVVDRIEPLSLSLNDGGMGRWRGRRAWGTSGVVVGDRAASGDDGLVSKASGDGG
jgi:hypothetical protein